MTSRLKSLPSLKGTNLMAVLEGGYNLDATAQAAEATVRVNN
jgi:acetoin utilization deacetylase AcuC-like enzyme